MIQGMCAAKRELEKTVMALEDILYFQEGGIGHVDGWPKSPGGCGRGQLIPPPINPGTRVFTDEEEKEYRLACDDIRRAAKTDLTALLPDSGSTPIWRGR